MLKSLTLSLALVTTFFAGTASASHRTPLESRIGALRLTMVHGLRSGALTPREVRMLEHAKVRFERRMALYLSDGFLTVRELRKLNRLLSRGEVLLARLMHNRERRFIAAVPVPYGPRPVIHLAPRPQHPRFVKKVVWAGSL